MQTENRINNKNCQREEIRNLHFDFAESRGVGKSYCPSEVAKVFDKESWRDYMNLVRDVADDLVIDNMLMVLQKNKIISELPTLVKGPIRLKKRF